MIPREHVRQIIGMGLSLASLWIIVITGDFAHGMILGALAVLLLEL